MQSKSTTYWTSPSTKPKPLFSFLGSSWNPPQTEKLEGWFNPTNPYPTYVAGTQSRSSFTRYFVQMNHVETGSTFSQDLYRRKKAWKVLTTEETSAWTHVILAFLHKSGLSLARDLQLEPHHWSNAKSKGLVRLKCTFRTWHTASREESDAHGCFKCFDMLHSCSQRQGCMNVNQSIYYIYSFRFFQFSYHTYHLSNKDNNNN